MEINEYCQTILFGSSLKEKLIASERFTDVNPLFKGDLPKHPHRTPKCQLIDIKGHDLFPKESELNSASARAKALHFFANHELLALELMALVLLKFGDAPTQLRLGLVKTMQDEQRHMKLYLSRMEELGCEFGDYGLNDFFWHCLRESPTILEFIAGMSLTLEQANLDFSKHFQSAFHQASDFKTAGILTEVYEDEIGHVGFGLKWFDRLRSGRSPSTRFHDYKSLLRLPLSPARAKGKIFDLSGRRKAGLDQTFINEVRAYSDTRTRQGKLFAFDYTCEYPVQAKPPLNLRKSLSADFSYLPLGMAKSGDIVMVDREPSTEEKQYFLSLGFNLPSWATIDQLFKARRQTSASVRWGSRHSTLHSKTKTPMIQEALLHHLAAQFDISQLATSATLFDGTNPDFGNTALAARELVLKSLYSSSGQGQHIFRDGQAMSDATLRFLSNECALHGGVLVEPWRDRILDFSINKAGSNKWTISRFFTTKRSGYVGQVMGSYWNLLDEEFKDILRQPWCQHSFDDLLRRSAVFVGQWLMQHHQYDGPFGMDGYFYRAANGQIKMQLVSEVNCRMTMAVVAQSYLRIIASGSKAVFMLVNRRTIQALGYKTFFEMMESLHHEHGVKTNDRGLIESGILLLGKKQPGGARDVAEALYPLICVGANSILKFEPFLRPLKL